MKIDTKCLHAGYEPHNGEPRQVPIYQSTTFKYDSSEDMGKLFDLEKSGYFYTRLQNPTNDTVAARIAAMEGGVAGMLTSSGQAANFFAVFNICEAGDHFIASSAIYGGTYNLFGVTMKKMGIDCTFVDPSISEEELQKCFRENTKCVFGETITNPTVSIFDIEKFAKIAHRNGVPLIVDNTFATPINCRPIEWGCDIVTHSTTKYMDGHGVSVGGVIVDSGNFDWSAHAEKFPGLTTPDESYHGLTYTEKFGKMAYITKATSQLMRDLGSIQSPQNAFYLNLGLESLAVRMERHCSNALAVARFLSTCEDVAWVKYPGLETDEYYELAQKYHVKTFAHYLILDADGNPTTTYSLTQQTIQDDEAYDAAMATYTAEKAIYEKQVADINAETTVIQQQDKTLELHLDQLDTEQQAIQTEMDAVKKVIDKNIEETFKTFA